MEKIGKCKKKKKNRQWPIGDRKKKKTLQTFPSISRKEGMICKEKQVRPPKGYCMRSQVSSKLAEIPIARNRGSIARSAWGELISIFSPAWVRLPELSTAGRWAAVVRVGDPCWLNLGVFGRVGRAQIVDRCLQTA